MDLPFTDDPQCPVIKLGRALKGKILSTITVSLPLGIWLTYTEWEEFVKIKFPGWAVIAAVEEEEFGDWEDSPECLRLHLDDPW